MPARVVGEALRIATLLLLTGPLAGCSIGLPSMVGLADPDETGSVAPAREQRIAADLDGEDWRRAKGALALALDLQGSGRPVKWENPDTGAEGEIAPTGSPALVGTAVCRDFQATVERRKGDASTHTGQACRYSGEDWEIRSVKAGAPL